MILQESERDLPMRLQHASWPGVDREEAVIIFTPLAPYGGLQA